MSQMPDGISCKNHAKFKLCVLAIREFQHVFHETFDVKNFTTFRRAALRSSFAISSAYSIQNMNE